MDDQTFPVGTTVAESHITTEDRSVTPPEIYRRTGTVVQPSERTEVCYDLQGGPGHPPVVFSPTPPEPDMVAVHWTGPAAAESSWEHAANLIPWRPGQTDE